MVLSYFTFDILHFQIMEVKDGILFFMNTGFFSYVSDPYAMILLSLWLTGIYITIVNVLMQFFFRYNALCMKRKLSRLEFCFLYFCAMFYTVGHGFAAFICFDQMNDEYTETLKAHPMYNYDLPAYSVGDIVRFTILVKIFYCEKFRLY